MKKKRKVNKKKFLSRCFLLILIIFIIIAISKLLSKKDKSKYNAKIIVNNENITENLLHEPYIDKDGILYLSNEDVKNIFDKYMYYEEETKKIITTSGTKVAAIDIENNFLEVNTASFIISPGILDYGNDIYIPISETTNIYNVECMTKENVAIIESLYNEFVTIKAIKNISVKEKTSGFSKTLEKVKQDEEIIVIEDAEKDGWIKVLTYRWKYRIYKK